MIIGFTSTRRGLREAQVVSLVGLLIDLGCSEFHHGDCVGGDVHGAAIAKKLGSRIVCHPPIRDANRGYYEYNDMVNPPYDYIVRDHHIVNDSRILVACPHTPYEITRSGSWTTVRYARSLGRTIYIIKPNGTIETENLQATSS